MIFCRTLARFKKALGMSETFSGERFYDYRIVPTRNIQIPKAVQDSSTIQYSLKVFESNPQKYPFVTKCRPKKQLQLISQLHYKEDTVEFLGSDPDLWNNEEYIKSRLIHISQLSLSELKDTVSFLLWVYEHNSEQNLEHFDRVKSALDETCSKKLKCVLRLSDIDLIDHFTLANSWLKISGLTSSKSQFLKCFVSLFSSKAALERLDSHQFLFLVFIMGTIRYRPNTIWTLSEPFGHKVGQVLPHLTFTEASLLAHGLHLLKIRISTEDSFIRTNLLKRLYECDVKEILRNNDEIAVSFLSRALLQRGKTENRAISRIQEIFLPYLDQLSAMTKIRLLAMVAESPVKSGETFIRTISNSMMEQLTTLRIKDDLLLVQSLHNSNCHNHQDICEKILSLITDEKRSHIKSGKIFVQLIGYLAKERVFKDTFLEEIFATINRWGKQLPDCQDPLTLAQVITEFTFELARIKADDDSTQTIQDIESDQTQSVILNILPHIATLDVNVRLDHPNYSGIRLDPLLRDKFLARMVLESDSSWVEKVRNNIFKDLKPSFGHNLRYDYLLPHATNRDFVFAVDKKHTSSTFLGPVVVPFPYDKYWNNLQMDCIRSVSEVWGGSDVQAVALIVPKRNEFDVKNGMVGKLFHKIRQLRQLGFNVGLISPVLYERAKRNGSSDKYLQKCLQSAISNDPMPKLLKDN